MDQPQLYIQLRQGSGPRRFLAVEATAAEGGEIAIVVPDKRLARRTHTELYHQQADGRFVRQMFRVVKSRRCRGGHRLWLARVSATRSAEARRHGRVHPQGMTARFGDEDDCPVLDLSDAGLALISTLDFELGTLVSLRLRHLDDTYCGVVKVKSVRELAPGSIRYGVCCSRSMGSAADELSRALPRIRMAILLLQPSRP